MIFNESATKMLQYKQGERGIKVANTY